MLKTILAGVKARTARLLLSSIAIALGVAFVSGTLVLGDGITEGMKDEFAKSARGVDVSMALTGERPDEDGISPATLDKVRKTPGVAGADVRSVVSAPLLTSDGKAKPATAGPLASTPELREYDLKDGRFPTSVTETAVDVRALATAKLSMGQQITLLDKQDGKHSFTIVGTFAQGANTMSLGGSEHLVVLPEALPQLTDQVHGYELVAKAAPGVTQAQLVADLKKSVGEDQGYTFLTGAELTQRTLEQIGEQAGQSTQVLLAFALIALVVAAMVIYNTFTILVAQRTRELALLRCVGASRGQVFGSVIAEAVVMGLFASVIGLLGGIGVSALMQTVIGSFSGDNTVVRLPVTPTTVLAAFGVGVLITVISAALPARKATKVAPVAALRTQLDSSDEVARTGKLRIAFAVLLGLAGAGVVVLGMGMEEEQAMLVTGAGTMLLLAMVVTLGPLLVGPVNRVLGVVPKALFGVPAKLASGNAGRNPKRTAATTAALMIGVTIVSLVTVVATSAKETANAEVDQRFPADYTVTTSVYSRLLQQDIVDALAAVPEVAKTAPIAGFTPESDGGEQNSAYLVGTTPSMIGDLVKPKVLSGGITGLKDGEVAISQSFAKRSGLAVGGVLSQGTGAVKRDLKVVAVVDGLDGNGLVTLDTLNAFQPKSPGYESVMVKLRDGVTPEAGRRAVEKVTDASPIAVIDSAAETKAQLSTQVDQVLGFIWALIGLAVIIALFGIANTLTLSVLERTRESALLRALGLTKGQLRLMLVVESVLMAVMGAAIGLVLGIGFGWILIKAISSKSFELAFDVPVGQIGVMLLAAVVAAVIAAAMPARRAGRTSVVAGMAEA
jgi:putative ABC transport system permease protein